MVSCELCVLKIFEETGQVEDKKKKEVTGLKKYLQQPIGIWKSCHTKKNQKKSKKTLEMHLTLQLFTEDSSETVSMEEWLSMYVAIFPAAYK